MTGEDDLVRSLEGIEPTPGLSEALQRYRAGSCSLRELLSDPAVSAAMSRVLEESRRRLAAEGITPERIAERVREVMEAESQTFEGRARLDPLREAMEESDPRG